ncbi:unnamed protein product [Spirodela intermedia]|uniref:Uncharacterized protein n=1 Tax=Spirodela intermedia TaxID=51605 RepID=A0A7I8JEX0_SPIIN|nr:unnamed protein product [Spirodela intermedia]CAA6668700.1 unnamed protein product [Spirodela intermedia]
MANRGPPASASSRTHTSTGSRSQSKRRPPVQGRSALRLPRLHCQRVPRASSDLQLH